MSLLPALSLSLLLLAALVASQGLVFPGESNRPIGECTTEPSGARGWCRPLQQCPPVLDQALKGIKYKRCGASGRIPIVCCPVSVDRVVGDPSSPITLRTVPPPPVVPECGFRQTIFSNGQFGRVSRSVPLGEAFDEPPSGFVNIVGVVGGRDAIRDSWPWMALLGQRRGDQVNWYCDGALLNSRWVLTAAHCLDFGIPHVIRLGEHDKSNDNEESSHDDYSISQTVLYPDYRQSGSSASYHDLALIELSQDVSFRAGVSPICLPWGEAALQGLHNKTVSITGWGATQFGGNQSDILQEAEVTVFPSKSCDEPYQILPAYTQKWPQGITEDTFLCAGKPEGGVDTCQGDSGGPLVHQDLSTNRFVLRGVVSQGYGCGHQTFPGLYVPVAEQKYLAWIKQVAF